MSERNPAGRDFSIKWFPDTSERETTQKEEKRRRSRILTNAITANLQLAEFINKLRIDGLSYHKNEIEDDLRMVNFYIGCVIDLAKDICENYKL